MVDPAKARGVGQRGKVRVVPGSRNRSAQDCATRDCDGGLPVAHISPMLRLSFLPHLLTRASFGLAMLATPHVLAQNPAPSSGVQKLARYTIEQAERGKRVFSAVCVECHSRSDMSNDDFRLKWNGRSALDLYERIRTTMPDNSPGSRSTEEYTDIVAYMMQLNGLPSGDIPLSADSTMSQAMLEILPPPGN